MKNKILIYGDCNLNIIDGSSIWVTSLVKLLSMDKNNVVDLLLKTPIKNDILIKSINQINNVKIFSALDYIKKCSKIDSSNIVKVVNKIDELRDYSCIIVRGFNVVKELMKSKLKSKIIPYLTDFCHNKETISQREIEELRTIYNETECSFVQTKQMLEYLKDVLKVDGKKYYILNPMVFKEEKSLKTKFDKSIVYAGKFAKKWNILELIEIMKKVYIKDPEIKLHIIGNKFNKELSDSKTKNSILNKLKNSPNIIYYGGLPRKETLEIIRKCKLGYNFRSAEVDNDNSLELSTKLLEYCSYEIPSVLRRTKMYEDLLGKDYSLFVESIDECVEKILSVFRDNEKYEEIKKNVKESFKNYSIENIYESIKPAIYSYPMKKMRLLIARTRFKIYKRIISIF